MLRRGTGADLQRRVHRETGDLAAVVRAAVDVTAGRTSPAPAHDAVSVTYSDTTIDGVPLNI